MGIAHTGRGVNPPAPFPCLSPAFALVLSADGKHMTDAETLAKYEAVRDEVLTDGHTVSVFASKIPSIGQILDHPKRFVPPH